MEKEPPNLADPGVFYGEVRRRAVADGVDWDALSPYANIASLPAWKAVSGEAMRQAVRSGLIRYPEPPEPKRPHPVLDFWSQIVGSRQMKARIARETP